jgi:hypothetical protein
MSDENLGRGTALYSLIPLADFKALLGLDDREDALSRFCLITAAYTIEQYCKRRLLRRKNTDYLSFTGEYLFTLREYPGRKILSVHAAGVGTVQRGEALFSSEILLILNITIASLMRGAGRIFLLLWFCGLRTGLQGRK